MFGFHYKLERKAIGFVLAIIGVSSIGGLVEIVPLALSSESTTARMRFFGVVRSG